MNHLFLPAAVILLACVVALWLENRLCRLMHGRQQLERGKNLCFIVAGVADLWFAIDVRPYMPNNPLFGWPLAVVVAVVVAVLIFFVVALYDNRTPHHA